MGPCLQLYPSLDPAVLATMVYGAADQAQVTRWENESRNREEEVRAEGIRRREEERIRRLDPKERELEEKLKEFKKRKEELEEKMSRREEELEHYKRELDKREGEMREYSAITKEERDGMSLEKGEEEGVRKLSPREKEWEEKQKEFNKRQQEEEERIQRKREDLEAYERKLEKEARRIKEAKEKIISQPSTTLRSQTKPAISQKPPQEEREQGESSTEEREIDMEQESLGATFKAPLMHIGETVVHIPLPLGTLSKIKELCPSPKKSPREAGAFLAKYSAGTSLDKEDIAGILSIVDPDSPEGHPVDALWTAHIEEDKDWVSFWKGMGNHWSAIYKGSSALQELVLAKQGPKEKFYEFCTRVYGLWKAVDNANPQLFTTTIMAGGDTKVTQLLKFTNPKWAEQPPDEFMKDARSRETSGVFEQKGGIFPSLTPTQTLPTGGTPPTHIMTMQPYPPMQSYPPNQGYPPDQGCFNCGELGHWKSQCPYRIRTNAQRGRGRNLNTGPRRLQDIRYPHPPQPQPPQPQPQYQPQPNRPPPRIPMQWPSARRTPQ